MPIQIARRALLQATAAGLALPALARSRPVHHLRRVGDVVVAYWDLQRLRPLWADLTRRTPHVVLGRPPTQVRDLLDPRWRGQVGTGHPAFSGTVGLWVLGMRKLYGWTYFEELERNRPLIGRSVNDTVTMLNSGERSVAAGPSALSRVTADRGNPVGVSYPPSGAVLVVSPSAVLANAPHPNAARLYLEYLLGPVHARIAAVYEQHFPDLIEARPELLAHHLERATLFERAIEAWCKAAQITAVKG